MPLSSKLKTNIATIVRSMPKTFDAHDVINVLYTNTTYRQEYDVCDKTYKTSASFNAQISQYICRLPGITATGNVDSLNIHKSVTPCMGYRK
jgi:hypothetical protein